MIRLRLGISFSSHTFNIHMGISISPHKSLVLLRIRLHPVLLKQVHPKTGKILLMASGIPGFGIRNTAHGIRNPTNDWNPESKFHWQRLESSTWNLESTTWNPESKTVLDSLPWGEQVQGVGYVTIKMLQPGERDLKSEFLSLCIIHKLAPLGRKVQIIPKKCSTPEKFANIWIKERLSSTRGYVV